MGFIYLITCQISGKVYVGQTINTVEYRWEEHKSKARQMIYHQETNVEVLKKQGIFHSHLYRAMAIHGIERFSIETLEECDDDELNIKEKEWIKTLQSLSPKGFNLMTGGGSGGNHSDVTKKRISQTKQNNIDKVSNRNPKLLGLPACVAYRNNPKKGGEMLRVNNHALCHGKNFLVKEYGTFEDTKAALLAFLKELEQNGVPYTRPKIGGEEFANMPGFGKNKHGYRVNIVRNGKNYDRKFHGKESDEDKKKRAIEYYYSLLEKLDKETPN